MIGQGIPAWDMVGDQSLEARFTVRFRVRFRVRF